MDEDMKPKKPRPSRAIPGATRGGSKPHGPAPLTEGLRLRMTQQQREAVEWAAEAAGVGPQEWIRGVVERALTRSKYAGRYPKKAADQPTETDGMPSATD